MNKKVDIYEYLNANNIWYEKINHEAVYNMDELSKIDIPYFDVIAKNLFIRDDKKRNYYLITLKGNKKINLKEFRKSQNTRALSFASEEELQEIMSLTAGSVSPFGLLNDENLLVHFYIDKDYDDSVIGIHPNDNTETIILKVKDLIEIIATHGNEVKILEIN
ncbi:MAG: prolyl-tRNA synthetase associated domain-containing protein [Bacilli bacterium]|jgi:Ala-tRNA(Pro) deacylase|nr:prolyl-tRNA synthetase associated domain-containing protein [Bacilli bacterium]